MIKEAGPEYAMQKTRRLLIILLICSVGMFGFGYALVPLYNVLCKNLGINGKTGIAPEAASAVTAIDRSRTITVQFLSSNNAYLPWKFYPYRRSIEIHPGENTYVSYYAKNLSNAAMTVQAIPSVAPGIAAKYLKKTECFCFAQQTLKAGASMNMPLIFHLDRNLPKEINTVTLAYTLFDVTHMKKKTTSKVIGKIN